MDRQNLVDFLNEELRENSIIEKLNYLVGAHGGNVIFTTSFGYEDQVITDIIFRNNFDIKVATLDTGRLFPETYKVYNSTLDRYKKPITVYFPPTDKVEEMVNKNKQICGEL